MTGTNLVFDKWLSASLNKDAYRLVIKEEGFSSVDLRRFEKLKNQQAFLYGKVSVSNLSGIRTLEGLEFGLVDTNIVLERPLPESGGLKIQSDVRFAIEKDEAAVVEVARTNFQYSRFHLDKNFPDGIADQIKAEWVRGYFLKTRGTHLIVGSVEGQPKGFLQIIQGQDGNVIIDLIAVDKSARNKGLATDMIAFLFQNFTKSKKVSVGTQIANRDSIRLYEKLGFRMVKAEYVFHHHSGQK